MRFDILKELFVGVNVIDKNGNIVFSAAKKPFEDFKVKNIEELNKWFLKRYNNHIPLFEEILVNNTCYWIERKKIEDYVLYLIEKCKYLDNLLEEVIIDPLTGFYNKKEILEQIKKILLVYLKYNTPTFSLLMFDIDSFKEVNDTYGYLAGDFVLKELAKLVKNVIRKSDIIGRFGEEEFIIILPKTKMVGAIKVAERLRKALEEYNFVFNNKEINITISVGVTSVSPTDSVESLIERCEMALYDAKRKGKNRVEYR